MYRSGFRVTTLVLRPVVLQLVFVCPCVARPSRQTHRHRERETCCECTGNAADVRGEQSALLSFHCAVARSFATSKAWTLVHGKLEGEWRGEGVAFLTGIGKHSRTQVMRAGVATVLHMGSGKKWGLLSAHVPHHATITHTEALMAQWGESQALATKRVIIGMDANEQFRPTPHSQQQEQQQGGTGRGESILAWLLRHSVRLPPQDLATPSHYPYDNAGPESFGLRGD